MIKNVSLIGAGAVGALYVYRLQQALGYDHVTIIADKERKMRYERQGFLLNGEPVTFKIATPQDQVSPADLIILATKNLQLEEAVRAIHNHVGEHTIILSLLNGIESERILTQAYGAEHVLYGFVTGLSSVHEGCSINFDQEGIIIFGECDNIPSSRTQAMTDLFQKANIKSRIPNDIHHEMWWKFMLNTGYNTVSAICRADYGACNGIKAIRECVDIVFREVRLVAQAEGVVLSDEDVLRIHAILASLSDEGKTSMLQDMEAGRETENNWFCGTVSRLGREHGIPTPICDFLGLLAQASEQVQIRNTQR